MQIYWILLYSAQKADDVLALTIFRGREGLRRVTEASRITEETPYDVDRTRSKDSGENDPPSLDDSSPYSVKSRSGSEIERPQCRKYYVKLFRRAIPRAVTHPPRKRKHLRSPSTRVFALRNISPELCPDMFAQFSPSPRQEFDESSIKSVLFLSVTLTPVSTARLCRRNSVKGVRASHASQINASLKKKNVILYKFCTHLLIAVYVYLICSRCPGYKL